MVRGAVHRPRQRDQRPKPRRRPQGGIRQLALGADEKSSRPDRSVQAPDLRAGRERVFQARGWMNASSPRRRGPILPDYPFLYDAGATLHITTNAGGYGSPE